MSDVNGVRTVIDRSLCIPPSLEGEVVKKQAVGHRFHYVFAFCCIVLVDTRSSIICCIPSVLLRFDQYVTTAKERGLFKFRVITVKYRQSH